LVCSGFVLCFGWTGSGSNVWLLVIKVFTYSSKNIVSTTTKEAVERESYIPGSCLVPYIQHKSMQMIITYCILYRENLMLKSFFLVFFCFVFLGHIASYF
jgi:hypothetical protein